MFAYKEYLDDISECRLSLTWIERVERKIFKWEKKLNLNMTKFQIEHMNKKFKTIDLK